MTAIFVPITSTWSEGRALVAVGAGKLDGFAGSPGTPDPLWQMDRSDLAGDVEITLVEGTAQVRATLTDQVAITKVQERVYAGFGLVLFKGPGGEMRLQRAALVDRPDVLGKSASAQFLKHSRRPLMSNTSVLVHDDEVRLQVRQAHDRKTEAARISKASNPQPGGFAKPAGEAQHQGTSVTAGGRGRDKAGYGEGTGGDSCMAAIRSAMQRPFKEAGGLIMLLGSRAA